MESLLQTLSQLQTTRAAEREPLLTKLALDAGELLILQPPSKDTLPGAKERNQLCAVLLKCTRDASTVTGAEQTLLKSAWADWERLEREAEKLKRAAGIPPSTSDGSGSQERLPARQPVATGATPAGQTIIGAVYVQTEGDFNLVNKHVAPVQTPGLDSAPAAAAQAGDTATPVAAPPSPAAVAADIPGTQRPSITGRATPIVVVCVGGGLGAVLGLLVNRVSDKEISLLVSVPICLVAGAVVSLVAQRFSRGKDADEQ